MRHLLIVCLSFLLGACFSTDYIGKSYEPTSKVDIYLDEADVKLEYEVMGEMTIETQADLDAFTSSEEMQEEIVEKAKEKGADGLIFGSLEKRQKGETTNQDYTPGSVSSHSAIKESKVMKARLIKYQVQQPETEPPKQ